jgi:hypothetical protein
VAGIAFEEQEVAKSLTALLLDDLERREIMQTTAEITAQPK